MLNSVSRRTVQASAAIAAFITVAAAPAYATPTASSTTANASGQQQPTRASGQGDRRICVRVQLPNTRIDRLVCRTQTEWNREGGVPAAED